MTTPSKPNRSFLFIPFHVAEVFNHVDDMTWVTTKLLTDIVDKDVPIKQKIV